MSNSEKNIKLFLVDDDALFLKSLEIQFLQHAAFNVETFATGESCIANLFKNRDIIILDYHLNGINISAMNGLETLNKIVVVKPKTPVVMLSSQDKIEVAVDCMHHHAFDYVVKSETAFLRLQNIIETIFKYTKMQRELTWYMERM